MLIMAKTKRKQSIITRWFITAINLHQRLPLPNTTLLSQILEIVYLSNGEPDLITLEIISRGLLKTRKAINNVLAFMKRINLLKKGGNKIEITDKYLPK